MNFIKAVVPAVLALALAACSADAAPVGKAESAQLEWTFNGTDQQKLLIGVIDSAEKTLDMAIYSLTEPGIVAAVLNAKKRGVAVRVITDRQQAGGKTQTEALKLLGSAGIPIKVNAHSGLMHLKMTIADAKIGTAGSFNYSKSAIKENDEILMAVRDEQVAQSFSRQFESMWRDENRFRSVDYRIAQPDSRDAPDEASEKEADAPFVSCAAARAAGKAPIRRGEPGYNAKLDGDGDGVACEKS